MKKVYLIILISIVWYKPLLSGDDRIGNQELKFKGSIIEYINTIHNDHNEKIKMDFEIRYFKFRYIDLNDVIEIYIEFDNDMLRKDGKLPMLGGAALYMINKKNKKIIKRIPFK